MDDTGHIWTLANQSQVTAGSIWNCCISFERYLVMIFAFYMHNRSLVSFLRNMVIVGVICMAVSVINVMLALKEGVCVLGFGPDRPRFLDVTMVSSFSIAWVFNLGLTCAAIRELKRIWIQHRTMVAGSQGSQENVGRRSAKMILMLFTSLFFPFQN